MVVLCFLRYVLIVVLHLRLLCLNMSRGTSSKQHWADNFNYTQRPIDFEELHIPDLDLVDGLGVSSTKDIYANLRNSEEENSVFTHFTKLDKESVLEENQPEKSIDITFQFPESQQGDTTFRENSFYSNFSTSSEGSGSSWVSGDDSWGEDGVDSSRRDSTMSRTMTGLFDKAEKTINATSDILHTAVKHAPILNSRYDTFVHTGFWDAYLTVRDFVHTSLRQELAQRPAHVMCTGHSLGGALATLACLDISLHTLPRVNEHLCRLRETKWKAAQAAQDMNESNLKAKDMLILKQKHIKCTLYTFGSPRIGKAVYSVLIR